MPILEFTCGDGWGGARLVVFLASAGENLSRSRAGELAASGAVSVNGEKKNEKLFPQDGRQGFP